MTGYVRNWERLSETLKRVMGTGVPEHQARADICNAIADRRIRIRIYWVSPRKLIRRQVRYVKPDEIPEHLRPADFDWTQSRVRDFRPWIKVHNPSGTVLGHWGLIEDARHTSDSSLPRALTYIPPIVLDWHRVELFWPDVTEVLLTIRTDKSAGTRPPVKRRSKPQFERAKRALSELYPHGVPDQATLRNMELLKRVGAKLKEKLASVSDDTILRVAGRRK